MDLLSGQPISNRQGLLQIEDCLDPDGAVVLPPGVNLISLIDRNIGSVGDSVAYRYLDYRGLAEGRAVELTWTQLGARLRAIAAHLQGIASPGDRVAIMAPQGLEFVAGFFGAIKAGMIAVPLFAPELPGHAERLKTALGDARPAVALTTTAAAELVRAFLGKLADTQPRVVVVDDVPDSAGERFVPAEIDVDDVSHLQYTSGSTRPPIGVEVTHRAVATNLLQMILSIDLLDRNTHGVSWLPLYHDMGLSMIGFPAVYGGHSTLMSPTAFIRRPHRWIQALAAESREAQVVTAAPNFAYEWTAQRGLPAAGENIDLGSVVMIIGSEPVSIDAIRTFNKAFAPYGLRPTAIKPSYGIAEATLLVTTTAPSAEASVAYFGREELAGGRAVAVPAESPGAVAHVSCGQVARSLRCVVVDPDTGDELPDGRVGEVWLQGDNIARGYWGRPTDTLLAFHARLRTTRDAGSHAQGSSTGGHWLRTGDLGVYLDGEFYIAGRMADLLTVDGRNHYPQDIEATVAQASPAIRRGYVAAFTAPPAPLPGSTNGDPREALVIIAERAPGTAHAPPTVAIEAIEAALSDRHGVSPIDVKLLPAGSIPRTTSGKLARRACREHYLSGTLGQHRV
jgi:fatty-acyl-CoA synthase